MPKRKFTRRQGFTLIELLVAMGIVAILAALGVRSHFSLVRRVRVASSRMNLTTINLALSMYRRDQGDFPADGKGSDLVAALAEHGVGKSILVNPSDGQSSENLYVRRTRGEGAETFVLAFPCLRAQETIVLLFGREPQKLPLLEVTHNGVPLQPGETVTGGTLDFGGGTRVEAEPGTEMMLIHSFELADGTPYGLVRVDDIGEVEVEVAPGWKFEVVTPAAIAGVEGTEFEIEVISADETEIEVESGTVKVTERTGMGQVILEAGEEAEVRRGEKPEVG